MEKHQLTSREHALIAAKAADRKKGEDIVIQDVSELLKVTDWFVIVTAMNRPQAEAIVDEVERTLRTEAGIKPVGREGMETGEWILLDYGDIVVHVFKPEIRDFYRLETLWGDAPVLVLPAEESDDDKSVDTED